MMPEFDYFDSRVLTGVINKRPVKYDVFGHMFTPRPPSASELFELHITSRGVSMLPSITNVAPGTMRGGKQTDISVVKAPRFRPKRVFRAAEMLKTQAGQTPYDEQVDPVERAIAEDMDAHHDDIDYTLEIMCAQAAVHGKIDLYDIVEGKSVPTFTVDFKRPASHTIILSGAAQWTHEDSDLVDACTVYDDMVQQETNRSLTDVYMGSKAFAAFRKHPDVKDTLDTRRMDFGTLSLRVQDKFKGVWNGLRVWQVGGTYVDLAGEVKHYLDPEMALFLASGAENVIEYGLPMDIECQGPTQYFAKQFTQDDPSGVYTIAESRPLPWTKEPGWAVLIKAVD